MDAISDGMAGSIVPADIGGQEATRVDKGYTGYSVASGDLASEVAALDARIAKLESDSEERRARIERLTRRLSDYSTDRELAANRLEAGEGTGEYEAMRGREAGDDTAYAAARKAAADAARTDGIAKDMDADNEMAKLREAQKNYSTAINNLNSANNSTDSAAKAQAKTDVGYARDEFAGEIAKAKKKGVNTYNFESYLSASEGNSRTSGGFTPASVDTFISTLSTATGDTKADALAKIEAARREVASSGMSADEKNAAGVKLDKAYRQISGLRTKKEQLRMSAEEKAKRSAKRSAFARGVAAIAGKYNPDLKRKINEASFLAEVKNTLGEDVGSVALDKKGVPIITYAEGYRDGDLQ